MLKTLYRCLTQHAKATNVPHLAILVLVLFTINTWTGSWLTPAYAAQWNQHRTSLPPAKHLTLPSATAVPDTHQVAAVPSKASASDDEDDWASDDVDDMENVTLYRLNTSIWRMTPRRKVVEVGQKLLRDNHIRQAISFSVQSQANTVNAYASTTSHRVIVTTDLLRHLSSDDELAAILGHEIGHILLGHYGITGQPDQVGFFYKGLFGRNAPEIRHEFLQNQELEADRRGLRLMVNSGYKPEAMASALSKITHDSARLNEGWESHPSGTVRLKTIERQIAALKNKAQAEATLSTPPETNNKPTASPTQAPEQPVSTIPLKSLSIQGWTVDTARVEVLKHLHLVSQSQAAIADFPTINPRHHQHQEQMTKPQSQTSTLLRHGKYQNTFARMMEQSSQGSTYYDVLFPGVRAYGGYNPQGQLIRLSLCNQPNYPRICHTTAVSNKSSLGLALEISPKDRFLFSSNGTILNYTLTARTLTPQGELMKTETLH